MPGIQSLHSHTTASDGKLSHIELLNSASDYHISAIAFTDHDGLPDAQTIAALYKNKDHAVKWIVGIEATSGLPPEAGGGPYSGLHIVGLFVDPTNKDLLDHCQKTQAARVTRMEKMVKNLKSLGFNITVDDCLKASGGEAVGRPHIVQALKSKTDNQAVIEKYLEQMRVDSQHNDEVKLKYDLMMERKDEQAPYALFLIDDSYVPNIYVEYEYWTEMDQTVSLIRGAGGLAIVAHYSTAKSKIPLDMLENFMQDKRIDGVETVYGVNTLEGLQQSEWDKDRAVLRNLAPKYHILKSGGADVHTARELEIFTSHQDYSRKTIGMAEAIISQSKVDTTWSSF